jgi:hypothetical protein
VDLVKPQVLQCIACKPKHASINVLIQGSTLCKGLIKYGKTNNNITCMITHVQTTHPRLFAHTKQQFSDKLAKPTIHVQQSRKKRTSLSAYAIIAFFGTINP